ncbi:MAG: hypothetical protein CSYNP_02277 [Syntrophus sp. SKADARSKE-3]|nr:hypothetical protein [Syntrophus sp. SKADARSKE-3]
MKSHRLSQKREKAANVLSAKRNPEVVNVKGSRMHPEVGHGFLKSAQPGITWKCGEDVEMDLTADIIVDDHVEIADHVKIFTHRHEWRHSRGLRKDIQKITAHSLTIGRDAFIGMGAMLIGVEEIGEGAIIGAGAVVRVKKIGPYEIWIGNPAELNGIRGGVITLDCL